MIDLLLALIERLIQLKNYRAERLRTVVSEYEQPSFEDLLKIHSDYIRMFEEVHRQAEVGSQQSLLEQARVVREAIDFLRQRRIDFEPVRDKVKVLARQADSLTLSPEVVEFVRSVCEYFPDGKLYTLPSAATEVIRQLKNIEMRLLEVNAPDAHKMPIEYLINCIALTIFDRRDKWARVCEAFAKCQLAAVTAK